jgi:hypothetical protein
MLLRKKKKIPLSKKKLYIKTKLHGDFSYWSHWISVPGQDSGEEENESRAVRSSTYASTQRRSILSVHRKSTGQSGYLLFEGSGAQPEEWTSVG